MIGGVTGIKAKNWMNQVDIAWVKAVEKNDIRLLARLATGTNGRTELAK